MKRLQNISLDEAYRQVCQNGFGCWYITGDYMKLDISKNMQNVKTRVFLGEALFIIALSAEYEGFDKLASETDFIDIWPSVKRKYPQLFEKEVKGDLIMTS